MVHILLLILKIVGIILLALITILLLALFWPVSYSVSGSYNKENYSINVRLGWMFHLLHFRYGYSGDDKIMLIRIFGIPINLKKEEKKSKKTKKHKKEQRQKADKCKNIGGVKASSKTEKKEGVSKTTSEYEKTKKTVSNDTKTVKKSVSNDVKTVEKSVSNDVKTVKKSKKYSIKNKLIKLKKWIRKIYGKTKNFIRSLTKNAKDLKEKVCEIKKFITDNRTKEAYRFTKKYVSSLLKHVFPKKIQGKVNFGCKEPDETGKMLGYIAMICSTFHVNMKNIAIIPDFENKVLNGNIKLKGHFTLGIVLYYCLRVYFKKEVNEIIKKFL